MFSAGRFASQLRSADFSRRIIHAMSRVNAVAKNQNWRSETNGYQESEGRADAFAIDGHSSVVVDLVSVQGMPQIEYWNISGSDNPSVPSKTVRHRVRGLEPHTWDSANWADFKLFKEGHKEFLGRFSSFIAAHPSSFAALYEEFQKPVLMNISTRYEHPFSTNPAGWDLLDDSLRAMFDRKLLFPVANNVGDQEYFTAQTGIPCEYAPSLCSYVGKASPEVISGMAIFSNNPWLTSFLEEQTKGRWSDRKKILPGHYRWADLASLEGAFVVPYNSSTMTVFELAALGVPIVIPSLKFLQKLQSQFRYGVMDQVSFSTLRGKKVSEARSSYLQGMTELEWWFEKSDFLKSPLVANFVTVVESLDDLNGVLLSRPSPESTEVAYSKVHRLRESAYSKFMSSIRE